MRITGWDPILAASLTANDVLLLESLGTGLTKKLSLQQLAIYLFGGTLSTGIFVTLDGVMTMTNKRLTSPKINSANTTSVTSAELDKLHGATLSTAELNLLTGLTTIATLNTVQTFTGAKTFSTIQTGTITVTGQATFNGDVFIGADLYFGVTKLNTTVAALNFIAGLTEALPAWMNTTENRLDALEDDYAAFVTRECSTGWTQSGSGVVNITAANVLSLLGISSGYVVNAFPCLKVWENPYSNVFSECAATLQITTVYTGGRTNFSEVEIDSLVDGKSYALAMRVELVKVP